MEVEIPDNGDEDEVDLEIEDGEEKKEEEDSQEVSDKYDDVTAVDKDKERLKKIKEVMKHSKEEVNSEQPIWPGPRTA